jgi:hypothetical protein
MVFNAESRVEGPDFICVGMPKAGTGWLFDQLQYHPDFWMPPVKEFDYLMREVPRLKNVRNRLERSKQPRRAGKDGKSLKWANRRPGDERDTNFLQEASASIGQPMDIGRYIALFRFKGDLLSGDVSPTYVTLKDDVIAQVAQRLPHTKVLLLVRDPVARASSQISMAYRRGKLDETLVQDPDALRAYLAKSKTTSESSFPTQLVARWKRNAPEIGFRVFLFDEIERDADRARRDILSFLGADPEKKSGAFAANHNRKSDAKKLQLADGAKAVLVEHFADEIRACAAMFGGPARDWVSRYGL